METLNPPGNQERPFPTLYHAHHSDFKEDLPFWFNLAQENPGPILELGCGTGRVLIPLAEAGYRVHGIDHDPGMLTVLKSHVPPGCTARIQTIQADLTDFRLVQRFSLVLLPCNTFSTLEEPRRRSTLQCVYRHLNPGGVFAVSAPNPALLASLETNAEPEIESIFTHPESGNPVQASCDWVRSRTRVRMNWHYDHLLPDGQVERLTQTVSHSLTGKDQIIQEFSAAGFSVEDIFGDFDRSPYQVSSPHLILLGRVS